MTLALICAGLVAWAPVGDPSPPPDLTKAYQEAKAQAGRSPESQVRLALWCEAHGLTAQRLHHLTLAILADPKNAAARGLMGLVSRDGRWQRPEAVANKARADASLAEYEAKRLKAEYTADAQWALGLWADEHGLKEQAKAHLTAVIRLDPSREAAWKKLGYKKHEGRWVTEPQLVLEKADAEAQKQADRKWKPLLERSKAMLDQPSKREEVEAALASVTDPRAVPMIGKVFAAVESTQPRAVQLLGQVDAPASSKALAYLAVFAKSAEARRAAAESLRGRDPREYANLLIAMIQKPIKYEVKSVGGPGSPGTLFVEGDKANVKRLYSPSSAFQAGDTVGIDQFGQPIVRRVLSSYAYSGGGRPFNPRILTGMSTSYQDNYTSEYFGSGVLAPIMPGGGISAGSQGNGISAAQIAALKAGRLPAATPHMASGAAKSNPAANSALNSTFFGVGPRDFASQTVAEFSPAQAIAESQRSAVVSQQQLASDVATLEARNKSVGEFNDQLVAILKGATGQNLPADRPAWERWWVDVLGYAQVASQTATNPTFVEVVPSGYQPQVIPSNVITTTLGVSGISCFGAGTPVRTIEGVRPIESLKVGDLVLTQSTDSGALGYRPILVVHHNPPSATFRIRVGGESIVSSHFHRFWVAGKGWVMARELRAGDPVRTLGGVEPVEAVEADKVQLVYNLDVAEDADFFAGNVGALVHDNTLPDPRLAPFDAAPKPEAVATARRAD